MENFPLMTLFATDMKKLILILIGIIIGIALSFIFAFFYMAPSYCAFEEKPLVASVNDLDIVGVDDTYGISFKNNPNLIVKISILPEQQVPSDISIFSTSEYNDFTLSDIDSNGVPDRWRFSNDRATFFYSRMNGYPDAVFSEPNELVVRIDEEYFRTREIDGRKFIQKGADLVEIDHIGNQCYKIKGSEPVE